MRAIYTDILLLPNRGQVVQTKLLTLDMTKENKRDLLVSFLFGNCWQKFRVEREVAELLVDCEGENFATYDNTLTQQQQIHLHLKQT